MIKVVGTIFLKDEKLLIVKPRKRETYQMVGGSVESNELPLDAAYREILEELNSSDIVLDKSKLELLMEFPEVATSDPSKEIYFYVYYYNEEISNNFKESEEIESFLWYDTSMSDVMLSNTLLHKVVPYCRERKLIK